MKGDKIVDIKDYIRVLKDNGLIKNTALRVEEVTDITAGDELVGKIAVTFVTVESDEFVTVVDICRNNKLKFKHSIDTDTGCAVVSAFFSAGGE